MFSYHKFNRYVSTFWQQIFRSTSYHCSRKTEPLGHSPRHATSRHRATPHHADLFVPTRPRVRVCPKAGEEDEAAADEAVGVKCDIYHPNYIRSICNFSCPVLQWFVCVLSWVTHTHKQGVNHFQELFLFLRLYIYIY